MRLWLAVRGVSGRRYPSGQPRTRAVRAPIRPPRPVRARAPYRQFHDMAPSQISWLHVSRRMARASRRGCRIFGSRQPPTAAPLSRGPSRGKAGRSRRQQGWPLFIFQSRCNHSREGLFESPREVIKGDVRVFYLSVPSPTRPPRRGSEGRRVAVVVKTNIVGFWK